MPEIFSIYNCGTSHNRQNLDETVADLARRNAGSENRDWMINDGPGSFSHGVSKSGTTLDRSLAAQAKTPGTCNPVTGFKQNSSFAATRGVIDGYGWDQNVDHTMAVLEATIDLSRTINMVGWSRGAITCFMIAHALLANPRTSGIDVNIFAFDPVPGPGNFDDPNKVTLPANVKRYAAVVQEDERRKIFKPVLTCANDAPGVKSRFYYIPAGAFHSGVSRQKRGWTDCRLSRASLPAEAWYPSRKSNSAHLTRLVRTLCEGSARHCPVPRHGWRFLATSRQTKTGGGELFSGHRLLHQRSSREPVSQDVSADLVRSAAWRLIKPAGIRQRAEGPSTGWPTTYISLQKAGIVN